MPNAYTNSEADLLARYYSDAAERMRQIILHPPGKTSDSQAWRQAWAAQKITQIKDLLQQVDALAAKQIGAGLSKAVAKGISMANNQMKSAGVRFDATSKGNNNGFDASFAIIDSQQIRLIARNTAQDLFGASKSMGDTAGRVLRQIKEFNLGEAEINRVIAGGLIDGMPRQAIQTLKKSLERVNDGKMVEVVDKNGEVMHFDSGTYARMVYVTKTSEAHVKSSHLRLQQEDIDLVQIIGNQTIYFCSEYLGQVYSLSGSSKVYPALSSLPGGGPPFHPNCSKSTIAFIEELQ